MDSEEPKEESGGGPDSGVLGEIFLSLCLVFGATFALLALEFVFPAIAGTSQAFLAMALLFVPGLLLRKRSLSVDDLGVGLGPVGATLKTTLLASLIVFPLFVGGFHILQTQVMGASAQWGLDGLSRWNQEVEHAPSSPCLLSEEGPIAWVDHHGLWVLGPPGTSLTLRGEELPPQARRVSCGAQGTPRAGTALEAHQGALRSGKHLRGLLVDLGARTRFQATVELDGARISEGSLRLGRYGDGASALDLDRTPWWLFTYFIVHLGLVALPEEWFFRGYLQGRLDRLWGTRFTLFGVRFGWGLVAASAAFAALHPILIPGFHRLLVFFPGLFFGWLRAKTGNIGAAVLVHALSNLLLAIISQMYGVV